MLHRRRRSGQTAPRHLPLHRLLHRCKQRCLHHCAITPDQTMGERRPSPEGHGRLGVGVGPLCHWLDHRLRCPNTGALVRCLCVVRTWASRLPLWRPRRRLILSQVGYAPCRPYLGAGTKDVRQVSVEDRGRGVETGLNPGAAAVVHRRRPRVPAVFKTRPARSLRTARCDQRSTSSSLRP